jgi:hypothetical protein
MKDRNTWCGDLREWWKWMLFIPDVHSPNLLAIDVFSEKALQIGNGFDRLAIVKKIPHEWLEDEDMQRIHELLGPCSYCHKHLDKFKTPCAGAKDV